MKSLLLASLLFHWIQVHAQSVNTLMGARAAGMGYASSILADGSALFNNVGALGWSTKSSCFAASEVQPTLPGANRAAVECTIVGRYITTGAGLFRFGDDLYSEQVASIAIGNKFGMTSLGAKINYVQYKADGFGIHSTLSVDFGGLSQITPQISIGAYIINLTQSALSPNEGLPTKLVAGIGFHPNRHFLLTTEIEKDLGYKATWRMGSEYTIHDKVFFRSGFNVHPSAAFLGAGVLVKNVQLDYSFQYGSSFMGTHQASALLVIGKGTRK